MSTFMQTHEVTDITYSKYLKFLEKDLVRNGRTGKQEDYVVFTEYKFNDKKACLLLFVDVNDQYWTETLEKVRKKSKKEASGKCEVHLSKDQDGNGKDDIKIEIKTATGKLDKNKVAEIIKEDLFPKDIDVTVVTTATLKSGVKEESTAANDLDKVAETINTVATDDKFINGLKEFMENVGSAKKLQTNIQDFLKSLKTIAGQPQDAEQQLALAKEALGFSGYINDHKGFFEKILEEGQSWLDEHPLKKAAKSEQAALSLQITEVENQLAAIKRLNRLLIQAEDYNEATYIANNQTYKNLSELYIINNAIETYRVEYLSYDPTKYSERAMFLISEMLQQIRYFERNNSPLKATLVADGYSELKAKLLEEKATKEKIKAKEIEVYYKVKPFLSIYEDYLEIENSNTPEDLKKRVIYLTQLQDKLADISSESVAQKDDVNPFYQRILAAMTLAKTKMMETKGDQLNELLLKADTKGGRTADNLFDVFMEAYRGQVAYTPEPSGNIYDGCTRANCQDFCTALGELFRAAGLTNINTSVVIAQYFMTIPVDGRWIDPTSKGNTELVGSDTHQWYFSDHWVVAVDGVNYCVITGRKGNAEVNSTIALRIGKKTKSKEINGYKFKELDTRDSRGYQYVVKEI